MWELIWKATSRYYFFFSKILIFSSLSWSSLAFVGAPINKSINDKIEHYDNEDIFLKLVKGITSKGFIRSNYKDKLVDLSNVRINLKSKK